MDEETDADVQNRVATAYEEHYALLRFIAHRRFRVPPSDVQPLIHDVFVSFMRHEKGIGDDRRWLAAAIGNACRNYWRNLRAGVALPEELLDPRVVAEDALARHDVAILFAHLSEACRSILRLRYLDGLDPGEIAVRCGTSPGYVRLKVHRCLEAAKRVMAELS
ncbi:MAG: Sigma-70, region 4 [Thermoanaerobaculia bacterium]|jgi:RNA polymerase sigma factor (sigma-70 family)|nr:Sigma-70, region 4 [Thermoanaerobaculia bacterium]